MENKILKRLLHVMDLIDMNPNELSRAMGKGKYNNSAVYKMISNQSNPKIDVFIALKKHAPKVNLEYIIFGKGQPFIDMDPDVDINWNIVIKNYFSNNFVPKQEFETIKKLSESNFQTTIKLKNEIAELKKNINNQKLNNSKPA